MFKLYYFFNLNNAPSLIFTNYDLTSCLDFINQHSYDCSRCKIISPNNRLISFNTNNELVFSPANCQ